MNCLHLGRFLLLLLLCLLLGLFLFGGGFLVNAFLSGNLPNAGDDLFLPNQVVVQVNVNVEHGDAALLSLAADFYQVDDKLSEFGSHALPHGLAIVGLRYFEISLGPGNRVNRLALLVNGVYSNEIVFLLFAGDPEDLLGVIELLHIGELDLPGHLHSEEIVIEQAGIGIAALLFERLDRHSG